MNQDRIRALQGRITELEKENQNLRAESEVLKRDPLNKGFRDRKFRGEVPAEGEEH
jgi:hypothetical protein